MSRDRKHIARAPVTLADEAALNGSATLTGLVKTTKGYAVAIAEFSPDGSLAQLVIGPSQANKIYAAKEHQRMLAPLAVKL